MVKQMANNMRTATKKINFERSRPPTYVGNSSVKKNKDHNYGLQSEKKVVSELTKPMAASEPSKRRRG